MTATKPPCQHPEVRPWDCGCPFYMHQPCCKHNYECVVCGVTMKGKPPEQHKKKQPA